MGLHLIRNDLNIDFVGLRKIAYAISIILILMGIASLVVKGGPRYGIDFAGGATIQIKLAQPITDEDLKKNLAGSGLPDLVVQQFGKDNIDYLLRISVGDETSSGIEGQVRQALDASLGGAQYEIQRTEMVGPKVGADLRGKAVEAIYYSILLIAFYISGRFEYRWLTAGIIAAVLGGTMFGIEYVCGLFGLPEPNKVWLTFAAITITIILCWRFGLIFALGAIISMLHDVLITVGLFSLMDKEFDLTIIAALLTLVGYSLNDTIVVYDRIRENLSRDTVTPLSTILNQSINQTLSRTVLTSGTTLFVVVALMIWGGGIIYDFALVMFMGIIIGTLSSIFVASPVLLAFSNSIEREDFRPKKDNRPRGEDGRLAAQV
jgi:protein-export membrane protein SecF